MVNNFEILEKNVGDIKELKVVGELDALVAPKLKERITKLVEGDSTKFIIDFEEVTHINSLAMGILRGKLKIVKEMGGDIKLIKLNEHIKTIFEMIGLDEIFEIYETEDEAVANFKKMLKGNNYEHSVRYRFDNNRTRYSICCTI